MYEENCMAGIGLFQLEILSLISSGETETIADVETHFESKDVVEYLFNKYNEHFFTTFDNSMYSNKAINHYFYEYSDYIKGNERRKYGIENENDGLLLILALLSDKIERESRKWTVEF